VRVKDQMIYQLLQERAAMRKDKTAMESYLKTLSRVSSQEMKKWAKLTDEMQGEIERLRAQLPPTRRSVPFR
jgi:gas vesicle protein